MDSKSFNLIVELETGGPKYYNPKPEVPGGSSGITVGVGVDLGYTTVKEFSNMFWEVTTGDQLTRALKGQGLIKSEAKAYLPKVKDLIIEWDCATYVFGKFTVPKFTTLANRAFPGLNLMPEAVQGALISLVFNRGPSLEGPKRAEMRQIREIVDKRGSPKEIARLIRAQKRIWKGTDIEDGMNNRREAEARFIEENT